MLCVVYPEDHSTFAFTHELISVNMNYMVNAFHQIRLNENIICMMLSCRFLATVVFQPHIIWLCILAHIHCMEIVVVPSCAVFILTEHSVLMWIWLVPFNAMIDIWDVCADQEDFFLLPLTLPNFKDHFHIVIKKVYLLTF